MAAARAASKEAEEAWYKAQVDAAEQARWAVEAEGERAADDAPWEPVPRSEESCFCRIISRTVVAIKRRLKSHGGSTRAIPRFREKWGADGRATTGACARAA